MILTIQYLSYIAFTINPLKQRKSVIVMRCSAFKHTYTCNYNMAPFQEIGPECSDLVFFKKSQELFIFVPKGALWGGFMTPTRHCLSCKKTTALFISKEVKRTNSEWKKIYLKKFSSKEKKSLYEIKSSAFPSHEIN